MQGDFLLKFQCLKLELKNVQPYGITSFDVHTAPTVELKFMQKTNNRVQFNHRLQYTHSFI